MAFSSRLIRQTILGSTAIITTVAAVIFAHRLLKPTSFQLVKRKPKPYKYSRLNDGQIRLLVLEPGRFRDPVSCHLVVDNLIEEPEFEAISYAWGDPKVRRPIICDGGEIAITTNLFNGLRRMRLLTAERVLWADAVCINQGDLDERAAQVELMGEIFSQATRVLIWLGEEEKNEAQRAFKNIRDIDNYASYHCRVYDTELRTMGGWERLWPVLRKGFGVSNFTSIVQVLNRSWFKRAWVLQEVVKARQATLLCGQHTLAWDRLRRIWVILRAITHFSLLHTLEPIFTIQVNYDQYFDRNNPLCDLSLLLWALSQFECTDPRDRIYSILQLTWSEGLHADYRLTENELARRVAEWSVSSDANVQFLSLAGIASQDAGTALPSWVPQLGHILPPYLFSTRYDNNAARSSDLLKDRLEVVRDFSIEGDIFSILGRCVDTVSTVTSSHSGNAVWSTENTCEALEKVICQCQELFRECASDFTDFKIQGFLVALWGEHVIDLDPFGTFLNTEKDSLRSNLIHSTDPSYLLSVLRKYKLLEGIYPHLVRRRFGATGAGRFGWIPWLAEPGDQIAIVKGSRVPYVVRPLDLDENIFTLVGECYVHGIMQGEAMDETDFQWQKMRLR